MGWVQQSRWGTGTDGNEGVQGNILPLTGQQHLQRKGEPLSTCGTAPWCKEHRARLSPAGASHGRYTELRTASAKVGFPRSHEMGLVQPLRTSHPQGFGTGGRGGGVTDTFSFNLILIRAKMQLTPKFSPRYRETPSGFPMLDTHSEPKVDTAG